ncbi:MULTISPECIES: Fic family protein [Photorhabdus]|uniref:protein adenylyltransferase n=1 Tax=Photorhabdus tasmaniensis TaxID=1004159 RepID=A0ABX0GD96_9GAMM|nr:Fic family protein [Photorhabdus tasmaniensis]NHB86392.1 cell filamentation protein Fic [Photorhabdus tasmaniensis]
MTKLIPVSIGQNKKTTTVSLLIEPITHIKKTIRGKMSYHYYWNNRTKEVIFGSGTLKTKEFMFSVAHILRYKEPTEQIRNRDIQLGDSVGVLFNKKSSLLLFGSVVGVDLGVKNENYFHILPHHNDFPFGKGKFIKIKNEKDKIYILSDGVNERYEYLATKNKIYAKYQYQLDWAEIILSRVKVGKFIREYIVNRALPIGELAFVDCHKMLFGNIYSWAGQYRKDVIVVGDRERPTMEHCYVSQSMKACLRTCNRNEMDKILTKRELVAKLVIIHRELAWIHPFQDGNGRTIRLYLQILCLSKGFDFNSEILDSSVKNKRIYHYAVRRAIDGKSRNLTALFNKAVSEIS